MFVVHFKAGCDDNLITYLWRFVLDEKQIEHLKLVIEK